MKRFLIIASILVVATGQAFASGALVYGRIAYDGSICDNCESEPQTTNLFGYMRWIDIIPIVDLSLGFDYASTKSNSECGNISFTDYGINASGALTLLSLGVVKTYAGGGVSYHYLRFEGKGCDERLSRNEIGYHGLVGLRSTFPMSPVNGFIEGRLSKVGGNDSITMRSLRIGIVLSIGG